MASSFSSSDTSTQNYRTKSNVTNEQTGEHQSQTVTVVAGPSNPLSESDDMATRGDISSGRSICDPPLRHQSSETSSTTAIDDIGQHKMATPPRPEMINDARLLINRRVQYNQHTRKNLEILCEEKSSRQKLERLHCSLPSSVKATFIMTFSPDGQKVASTHGDHRIYICDLNTGKLLDTLTGHPKTPWCLAWHPYHKDILASGCLAGQVRVWDLKTKACEIWASENSTIIISLDFHPRERVLVIATSNDINFWDWSEAKPFAKRTTLHDKEKVRYVAFDSSGTKLITGISNLPKFAGYSNDSLQNRIIDNYYNQATLDQTPNDSMTQNSEITNPVNNFGAARGEEWILRGHALSRTPAQPRNNEPSFCCQVTTALTRVAHLYRQLELLEDSMRHSSFLPYMQARPLSPMDNPNSGENNDQQLETERLDEATNTSAQIHTNATATTTTTTTTEQQQQASTTTNENEGANQGVGLANNHDTSTRIRFFEPYVVSLDESLEQIQLMPLSYMGTNINMSTLGEQYPIEVVSTQLNLMVQLESINQASQNFIRISKLMSSARLYRQIVQQIQSFAAGRNRFQFQPNQLLTAQCVHPRSSRTVSNLPIIFRNVPLPDPFETPAATRLTRHPDPILAIQFRNTARNVPLVSVCKIELLCARAVCIAKSQLCVEQMIADRASNGSGQAATAEIEEPRASNKTVGTSSEQATSTSGSASAAAIPDPPYHYLLNQLHQLLVLISHTPLTTTNVHVHVSSIRSVANKLLRILSSMVYPTSEGSRLVDLVHSVADSLTGRSWTVPLGDTFNDIRLDVIHTLCVVDLSLHLTRQVQLLQLQRLSALARIEESQRESRGSLMQTTTNTINNTSTIAPVTNNNFESVSSQARGASYHSQSHETASPQPGPSRGTTTNEDESTDIKRKFNESSCEVSMKRRKIESTSSSLQQQHHHHQQQQLEQDFGPNSSAIETMRTSENNLSTSVSSSTLIDHQTTRAPDLNPGGSLRSIIGLSPSDRLAQITGSRLHVDSIQTMSPFVMLRFNHRHLDSQLSTNQQVDLGADHHLGAPESRRRALSQDNLSTTPVHPYNGEPVEAQYRSANYIQPVSINPSSDPAFETGWQRLHYVSYVSYRGGGNHLWFTPMTFPLSGNSNFRLQCWNFSMKSIPNVKNSQACVVVPRCRIHNDASIDISSDGCILACLTPHDDGHPFPALDLKIISLKAHDFANCYHQIALSAHAISVSLSPSASFAVVGFNSGKFTSNDPNDDDITVASVLKLTNCVGSGAGAGAAPTVVRDVKIKRGDAPLNLNAIRWTPKGIVYNVGPQHHQRYFPTIMRRVV